MEEAKAVLFVSVAVLERTCGRVKTLFAGLQKHLSLSALFSIYRELKGWRFTYPSITCIKPPLKGISCLMILTLLPRPENICIGGRLGVGAGGGGITVVTVTGGGGGGGITVVTVTGGGGGITVVTVMTSVGVEQLSLWGG
jgi:hypothetical protein